MPVDYVCLVAGLARPELDHRSSSIVGPATVSDEGARDGRQMCSDTEWNASSCLDPEDRLLNGTIYTSDADDAFALSSEPWAAALLSLAAANVIAALLMEVYVICRATRDVPSRRHLFLGQMLLLGLLLGDHFSIPTSSPTLTPLHRVSGGRVVRAVAHAVDVRARAAGHGLRLRAHLLGVARQARLPDLTEHGGLSSGHLPGKRFPR